MKTKHTFEDFLIDKHAEDYIGTGDDMPDAFNNWLEDISIDDWFEYADKFAKKATTKLRNDVKLLELYLENTRTDVQRLKENNVELLEACKGADAALNLAICGELKRGHADIVIRKLQQVISKATNNV